MSVFDSAVQGGDAVWEGLRVYDGKIFALDSHLERLFDSAKAMDFAGVPTKDFITTAIFKTLAANGRVANVAYLIINAFFKQLNVLFHFLIYRFTSVEDICGKYYRIASVLKEYTVLCMHVSSPLC